MSNVLQFPGAWPFGAIPRGQASILYIDPPWRFETHSDKGKGKSPDNHYRTMTKPELRELSRSISQLAADNSLLIMWAYDPLYDFGMEFGQACGFKWVTPLFKWNKIGKNGKRRMGTGYHTRAGGSEECWLFKRGKGLKVMRHDIRKDFDSPIREHSRKPDEVAGWIVDLYGDVPRIELFARTPRPGWISWGNETEKFSPIQQAAIAA